MRDERSRAGVGAMVSVGLGGIAVLLAVGAAPRASTSATVSASASASGAQAARPPAGQPGQAPLRVGGAIAAPRKTRHVNPIYPQEAKDARVQGMVILEAQIDREGRVGDARVLRSIPLLDQAAIDAVRQWEYTVTQLNGQAVPVIMTVTVNFTLGPDGSGAAGHSRIDQVVSGQTQSGPGGLTVSSSGSSTMHWDSSTGAVRPGMPMTPPEEAARTPFLIERHRAGVVQSGMSVDDLQHILPREQTRLVDLALEGMFTPALEIRLEPNAEAPAIVAEFMPGFSWRLRRLTVLDARFRTADGFGVGTTVGELMDRYPGLRISHGETHQVMVLPEAGTTFRIANDTQNLDAKVRIREARIDAVVTGFYVPRPPAAR